MDRLAKDPEYQAQARALDREQEEKRRERRRAEQPLVQDLRRAGFDVATAWDLVNTAEPYPDALPILLDHLGRPYPDKLREGMARALAVKPARFAWSELVRLYRAEPADTSAKDGLAVALSAIAETEDELNDLVELVNEADHGGSRIFFLEPLLRFGSERHRELVSGLVDDAELGKQARLVLKRVRRH